MAENPQFLYQLLETFHQELQEHLQALNGCFLEMERKPEAARRQLLLQEAFREAHSLKGAARAVDFATIADVAQRVEDILGALRRSAMDLESEHFDLLYAALDLIPALFVAQREGHIPSESLPHLLSRFSALIDGGAAAVDTAGPTATAPPSGEPSPTTREPGPEPELPLPASETLSDAQRYGLPEDTVRLPAGRLDLLLARAGELVTGSMRGEQRQTELGRIATQLHTWRQDWNQTRQVYGKVSRYARPVDRDLQVLLEFVGRSQDRLRGLTGMVDRLIRDMSRDATESTMLLSELHEDVRRLRMLPVGTLFSIFPRLVRDAARAAGKEVVLQVEGWETEIDRQVLQDIKDPVMHLLRNAVDHGIEEPVARLQRGKSPEGRIVLRAAASGGSITIQVEDDGAGIDLERVRVAALGQQVVSQATLQGMTDEDVLRLVFRPGLSTSRSVSDLSGRGVGLDVVWTQVLRLGGIVDLVSTPGRGARFTLSLPLTVLTTHVLLVRCGGQVWAIPSSAVDQTVRFRRSAVHSVGGRAVLHKDGQLFPVVALSQALGMPARNDGDADWSAGVVLGSGGERVLFGVDGLVGEQEVVVKRLRWPLAHNRYLSGGTVLGDGSVALVLNLAGLLTAARGRRPQPAAEPLPRRPTVERPPIILVVDDSITTRTLEKNILETAGFTVVVAADGIEAMDALCSEPGVDLVVADVDMPRMNGFDLTSRIRSDPQLSDLPVVLVTSLESPEHRQRGLEVGANVYLAKSTFDQRQLLQTIQSLIG